MKILIADRIAPEGRAQLEERGHKLIVEPKLGPDELPAALAEHAPGVLVVRSTRVTADALGATSELELVIRAGAGVNTIDLETASRRGIFVANCPGKNAIAVAELTLGLILALDRDIPNAVADLRAGRWRKKFYGKAEGLHGKTLGLVGFGSIAQEVAARARAFGLQVQAWTPRLTLERCAPHGVQRAPLLENLLETSDIVSLHVPRTSETRGLFDAAALARMPDGAMLINMARDGIVDEGALAAELKAGRLRAATDVFEGEPSSGEAEFSHPLLEISELYATPHVGASTRQAALSTAAEVVRIIDGYVSTGQVPNCVNVVSDRPGGCALVVRHLDRVGVLASIFDVLRKGQLNVKEMHNVIFEGNEAACATIVVEKRPPRELMAELAPPALQ